MTRAVDLFAGWGGFTLGAELAGVDVVWAANHWPLAVETHEMNHPEVEHVCQDLRQADWTSLPAYELLLAAPACQGHSTASQPQRHLYHDALRATAWAVIDCVEVTRPETVLVENVPTFARWELYDLWLEALRRLGYEVEGAIHRASHYGVAQRRDRLIVCASRVGARVTPRPAPSSEPAFGPLLEPDAPGWRPVSGTTPAARARIAKGRRNHGHSFLSQHVTGHPGVSLDEPIRTITTKDQWVVVRGDEYRPLTLREHARAMGFPETHVWPETSRENAIRGLGNAICPDKAEGVIAQALGGAR